MRLLGVLVALSLVVGVPGSTAAPVPGRPVLHAIHVRTDMWSRLAEERQARGLAPLVWNGRLSERGAAWSKHMAAEGHIFHSDLKMTPRQGVYNYLGEAVGFGSAGVDSGSLFNVFMGSPAHRDIFLSPGFTSGGIGVWCSSNHRLWVTVTFGRRPREGQAPTYVGGTPSQPRARTDKSKFTC